VHHIKNIANKHQSYLQDTPDFLRTIEHINKGPKLPRNAMLVTIDAIGAYTNIPQEDGIKVLKEALEKRINPKIPTEFIAKLMELTLKHSLFEFHYQNWKQEVGTAMGVHPAPSYANIYLAKIDEQIRQLNHGGNLLMFKRFLDDLFQIFVGTTKQLHQFFKEINQIHPTMKFTMSHTSVDSEPENDRCDCEAKKSIPFLDTSCSIENGRIETDLFKKETDKNQYLLTSSCHPIGCTKNIPYSLGLRIVRICSNEQSRDKRLAELKDMLLARKYPERLVDSAIDRARAVPRKIAIRKVIRRKATKRPVFSVKYDPRLPSIPNIQAKHWRAMTSQDQYLAECFPEPPLTAFRRQRNIRDLLIKAKVPEPPKQHAQRNLKGMTKCGKSCTACPYIKSGKIIKINENTNWNINKKANCESYNVVYLIECEKENCKERYIGETGRLLRHRLADHRGYISNKVTSQATGLHFNLPGHSLADLRVTVLEQVKKHDIEYRKEREKYFIRKLNTYNKGMNRKK
jgi:hypothetical protein